MDVSPFGMAAVAFDAEAQLLATGAGWIEPAIQDDLGHTAAAKGGLASYYDDLLSLIIHRYLLQQSAIGVGQGSLTEPCRAYG